MLLEGYGLRRRDAQRGCDRAAIPLKSAPCRPRRSDCGTLRRQDAPVGFRAIRLRFDLDTEAPQEQLDQL
jgi:hypothetical protein